MNGADINNVYATKKELEEITATGGDGNTKYTLSKSGSLITLTGTDGSTSSVSDTDTHIEVIDSLESTDTTRPASANATRIAYGTASSGVTLANAAQATADSAVVLANSKLNASSVSGETYVGDLNNAPIGISWVACENCSNSPTSSGFGYLEVWGGMQRFTNYQIGEVYYRSYVNSAWESWKKIEVGYADTAGSATKATQDGNGNTITSTYVPFSGGGTITAPSGSDVPLCLKPSIVGGAYLGFKNSNNEAIGYLGVDRSGKPIFYDSGPKEIIHSGNIGSQSVNFAGHAEYLSYSGTEGKIASTRVNDESVALITGGWTTDDAGYGYTWGTTLDITGPSTWYNRLAFRTDGQIDYWQGINTKTLEKVGTIITSANIGSQSVANSDTVDGYSADAFVLKSGDTMSGRLKVSAPIMGFNYTNGTNLAAFIFDKPGADFTGIGANGESDTIYFGAVSNQETGAWDESYKQKWKFNGDVIADNLVVKRSSDGTAYRDLGTYYNSGSTDAYIKISFPSVPSWTMLTMELTIRQDYGSGKSGKLIIYANQQTGRSWYNFYAVTSGRLDSNIKVYGSDNQHIYITGVSAWGGLSVDRMLIGDSAVSSDLTNISITGASSLPETYQTADMSSTITSETIGSQSVSSASTATVATALAKDGDTAHPMTFHWNGLGGQPTWVWGGEDASNMYVYNPSNFTVYNSAHAVRDQNGNVIDSTYVFKSGDTMSGALLFSTSVGKISFGGSGLPIIGGAQIATGNLAIGANGIGISGTLTRNDGAGIFLENGGSDEVNKLVIALGDDSVQAGTDGDGIVFRYYDTAGNVTYESKIPFKSGTIALTSDIPTSLPASDVYSWAKAASKPSYSWSEIGSRPTALSQFTNDSGFLTYNGTIKYADWANNVAWVDVDQAPSKLSQFTNDSGFITSSGSCNYANSAGSAANLNSDGGDIEIRNDDDGYIHIIAADTNGFEGIIFEDGNGNSVTLGNILNDLGYSF